MSQYTITADSRLTDEAFQVEGTTSQTPAIASVVLPDGTVGAFVISTGGELFYIERVSAASDGYPIWKKTSIHASGVLEVATMCDQSTGYIYTFFTTSADVRMVFLQPGSNTWAGGQAVYNGTAVELKVTAAPSGLVYGYCRDGTTWVLLRKACEGFYNSLTFSLPPDLAIVGNYVVSAGFAVVFTDDFNFTVILQLLDVTFPLLTRVLCQVQIDHITITALRPQNVYPGDVWILDAINYKGTIVVFTRFRDSNNETMLTVFSSLPGDPNWNQNNIPGVAPDVGQALVAHNTDLLSFYFTVGNVLWTLNQDGDSGAPNYYPTFIPLLAIEKDVMAFGAPTNPQGALFNGSPVTLSSVFFIGTDQMVHYMGKNPTDGSKQWRQWPVQVSSLATVLNPTTQPAYRTQVKVSKIQPSNSNILPYLSPEVPAIDVPISLTASSPVSVIVNGLTYHIGSSEGVVLHTDATGAIFIIAHADVIDPPPYTITIPGDTASLVVRPNDVVDSFLSGNADIYTGTRTIPAMSPNTITTATTPSGAPVFNTNSDTAQASSDAIKYLTTFSPTSDPDLLAKKMSFRQELAKKCVGFAINARDRKNPTATYFKNHKEMALYKEAMHARAAQDSQLDPQELRSLWGKIKKHAEDAWQGIKQAATTVTDFVVTVGHATVSLALNIGGKIVQVFDDIVATAENCFDLICSVFNAIGAAVEDIINWIKDLFNWGDIKNTIKVAEHMFMEGFAMIQHAITASEIGVDNFFIHAKDSVDTKFNEIEATLQGQSFQSLVQSQVQNSNLSAGFLKGLNLDSRAKWLLNQLTNFANSTNLSFFPVFPTIDELVQFAGVFGDTDIKNDFEAAYTDFKDFLMSAFSGDSQNFATNGINSLLEAIRNFLKGVLDIADAGIQLMLTLVSIAIQMIQSVLTSPLPDIPIITWAWNLANPDGAPLSLLGLISFTVGFTHTIAYKIENNNQAPFPQAITDVLLAWHFNSTFDRKVLTTELKDSLADANKALTSLSITCGFISVALDITTDIIGTVLELVPVDYPTQGGKLMPILGWISVGCSLCCSFFAVPGGLEDPFYRDGQKSGTQLVIAAWSTFPLISFINAIILFMEKAEDKLLKPNHHLLKLIDNWGKIAVSVVGGIGMVLGPIGTHEGIGVKPDPVATKWGLAVSICNPFPNTIQFLRLKYLVIETESVTLWLKEGLSLAAIILTTVFASIDLSKA